MAFGEGRPEGPASELPRLGPALPEVRVAPGRPPCPLLLQVCLQHVCRSSLQAQGTLASLPRPHPRYSPSSSIQSSM